MRKLIVVAMLSFGLASCGPALIAASAVPHMTDASTSALAKGTQALIAAHNDYVAAARIATQLVEQGVIRGSSASTLRAWNADALKALDAGYATADGATRLRQASIVSALVGRIRTLTGGG